MNPSTIPHRLMVSFSILVLTSGWLVSAQEPIASTSKQVARPRRMTTIIAPVATVEPQVAPIAISQPMKWNPEKAKPIAHSTTTPKAVVSAKPSLMPDSVPPPPGPLPRLDKLPDRSPQTSKASSLQPLLRPLRRTEFAEERKDEVVRPKGEGEYQRMPTTERRPLPSPAPAPTLTPVKSKWNVELLEKRILAAGGRPVVRVQVTPQADDRLLVWVMISNKSAGQRVVARLLQIPELKSSKVRIHLQPMR